MYILALLGSRRACSKLSRRFGSCAQLEALWDQITILAGRGATQTIVLMGTTCHYGLLRRVGLITDTLQIELVVHIDIVPQQALGIALDVLGSSIGGRAGRVGVQLGKCYLIRDEAFFGQLPSTVPRICRRTDVVKSDELYHSPFIHCV